MTTDTDNIDNTTTSATETPTASSPSASPKQQRSRSKSLPRGKYTLVGIDVDTTGRRLIDEIVQLSAYTPTSQYSQYIMPYMNLNPAARQRHQIRVITVGFFRMLKSMQTYKIVKTKSEIAALLEFLDWLEKLRKAENSNGVILIYHENRKFIPYMILEAFKKYNLQSRLLSSVRAFVNGYEFSKVKCESTMKQFSLRELSKVLLNVDQNNKNKPQNIEASAAMRARLAFEIAQHLAKGEMKDVASLEKELEIMSNIIYEHSHPVSYEIAELKTQHSMLEKQNSLRPIFLQYFKTTLYYRVKGVTFRRILSESGQDFVSLNQVWIEKKREGVAAIVDKLDELGPEEKVELIDLLDCHFDPDKTPIKPIRRQSTKPRSRSRRSSRRGTGTNSARLPNKQPANNKENVTPKDGKGDGPGPESNIKTPIKTSKVKRNSNTNIESQSPQNIAISA
jgi:maternal-effect protein exuperantia